MTCKMVMRVLVTGTGYVGRFLIPALEKDGYHVVAVSRSSKPLAMDLCNPDDCERVLQEVKPDVIVHTAALSVPAKCEADEVAAMCSNAPQHFARIAQELNPAVRFVFLSTDQVLDGKGHLVPESIEAHPINVYGKSKLKMEAAIKDIFAKHTIFRMSFVYGPEVEGAHNTFLQFALDKLRQGKEFDCFVDQKIRSCIYIDDVVAALRLAVQGNIDGVVNLGGPEPLSRVEFCQRVARHVGVEDIVKGTTYSLPTPSPADISMDISRLSKLLGRSPSTLSDALVLMDAKL
ncbi:unnamed protein product [Effrenium voratum]|nr:unnamed protein product [Effrenium voratum]